MTQCRSRWQLRPGRWGAITLPLLGSVLALCCEPLDIRLFPPDGGASVSSPPIDVEPSTPPDAGEPEAGAEPPAGDAGAGAPACRPGAVACEACVQAGACPAGRVCHPRSGECVVPCDPAQPDCPGSSVCSPLRVCVTCLDDVQCGSPDARVCDTDRGVCVECVNDDDCTAEPLERPACMAGLYRCGCQSNADCSGGAICEIQEEHCEIEDD